MAPHKYLSSESADSFFYEEPTKPITTTTTNLCTEKEEIHKAEDTHSHPFPHTEAKLEGKVKPSPDRSSLDPPLTPEQIDTLMSLWKEEDEKKKIKLEATSRASLDPPLTPEQVEILIERWKREDEDKEKELERESEFVAEQEWYDKVIGIYEWMDEIF